MPAHLQIEIGMIHTSDPVELRQYYDPDAEIKSAG
jgi:hypothetical protein